MTSVENKLDSFGCWWVISELTNINENNDNLQYDELIGICIYIIKSLSKHFQENINTSD